MGTTMLGRLRHPAVMAHQFYVYILTNQSRCYYVGMTSNLHRRWWQHLHRFSAKHTRDYHIARIVYVQVFPDKESARAHERSVKRRTRARKLAIIRQHNPNLEDLSVAWGWRDALASKIGWRPT
jgi:putative endonuclease